VFGNFNKDDNSRRPTFREALQASINLPFVRLMREIVRHVIHQTPGSTASLLGDDDDPRRQQYLERFADREGQTFVRKFWRKTDGRNPDDMQVQLFEGLRPDDDRLAAVFRYIRPTAPQEALKVFLDQRLEGKPLTDDKVDQLYKRYAPEAFGLPDRGYIARVHPLELWVVAYRLAHPEATLSDALRDSTAQRQEVYGWLFKTRAKEARDSRIYTMLEVEAFLEIHRRWTRLGYPFPSLVPSLATALGSSGDRPAALAELMGIVANDGVRISSRRINAIHFAEGTPYETVMTQQAAQPEQVLPVEVAQALRQALSEVVERGTARRLSGAFQRKDGSVVAVGGKTGTGDNRIVVRGKPVASLNRTATFVFYLGQRHFGTLTAYVVGPTAAKHKFTSGLPVQILRAMGPVLVPHLGTAQVEPQGCVH
jgi:membrane peptidoglycan carboxypeptidase